MWLLNVRSEVLEYFEGHLPEYAILSHRWDEQELSFQDAKNGLLNGNVNTREYKKVRMCCLQAERDGLDYVWIDTCCIDKGSSAELSEAINSMFGYYREARVCYAFLLDVNMSPRQDLVQFEKSAWFIRGWTLQELLAPHTLRFYDQNWAYIGSKIDTTIANVIERITNIPVRALNNFVPQEWSIASRMSWASKRETTRIEDSAYCLLGIFDINMTLLYGERQKAFDRLQQEIMKFNMDRSIFLWSGCSSRLCSMLACSPACFWNPGPNSPILLPLGAHHAGAADFDWATSGLRLTVKLVPLYSKFFLAFLGQCQDLRGVWIFLQEAEINGLYQRISLNGNNHLTSLSSCYSPNKQVTISRAPILSVNIPHDVYKMEAVNWMVEVDTMSHSICQKFQVDNMLAKCRA